jgi:uncharacterized protein (DUF1697 family)
MPRQIALLRGINVGGNRIIKMEQLRAIFTAAGARDVETYIQSGNVVFSHPRPAAARFEEAIAEAMGFAVPVVLRDADEMATLSHPFDDDKHVHVMFAASPLALVEVTALRPERYVVAEREIYVYLPDGAGRSRLAAALGKLPVTARNWRTVQQLCAMARQPVEMTSGAARPTPDATATARRAGSGAGPRRPRR